MIYIVEDDNAINELEQYALQSSGYAVCGFGDAASFWAEMDHVHTLPELILLDVMLPGQDGFSIVEQLRADSRTASVPVIMVTAKTTELDTVRGLLLGADDYISKPFGVMELVGRVKAVLRRAQRPPVQENALLSFGNIQLDDESHIVTVDGHAVELTFKEYSLLRIFLRHPEQVLARETIMQQVWDTDFAGESRTVDMHVRTLRQKLGDAGHYITTVRKVGYKLSAQEEEA